MKDGHEEIAFTGAEPFEWQMRISDKRAQDPAHLGADEGKYDGPDAEDTFGFAVGWGKAIQGAGHRVGTRCNNNGLRCCG